MSGHSYIRRTYLITYDIVDNKNRAKVFDICSCEGDRVQYSVFMAELNEMELINLKCLINENINSRTDQVLFIDLGASRQDMLKSISSIGIQYSPPTRCIVI